MEILLLAVVLVNVVCILPMLIYIFFFSLYTVLGKGLPRGRQGSILTRVAFVIIAVMVFDGIFGLLVPNEYVRAIVITLCNLAVCLTMLVATKDT